MNIESNSVSARQEWMSVLAKADWADLEQLHTTMDALPECKVLRAPETGTVMVRGRMGGTGRPFNTGEATVTRCSVENEAGLKGHSYVMGRNKMHALLAARLDVALQDEHTRKAVFDAVISPLKEIYEERLEIHRRKIAATKVDFFTLVRGEDN